MLLARRLEAVCLGFQLNTDYPDTRLCTDWAGRKSVALGPAFQRIDLGAGEAEDDESRRSFDWHSKAYFRRRRRHACYGAWPPKVDTESLFNDRVRRHFKRQNHVSFLVQP